MKAKRVTAISVALGIIALCWTLSGSLLWASIENDKAEIVALNQRLAQSFNKRDINAMIACYMDDEHAVFYEDTIPFQLEGTSALRKYTKDFFDRNESRGIIRGG